MKIGLAQGGIKVGWKAGATVWPREVNCGQINLAILAGRIEHRRAKILARAD
jgi:hypothetical protein